MFTEHFVRTSYFARHQEDEMYKGQIPVLVDFAILASFPSE